MTIVLRSPPMIMVTGSAQKRATDRTPGTWSNRGTCSLSYTSLKTASRAGSTSIAAENRYGLWIGMIASWPASDEFGTAHRAEVAPPAHAQVLGALEVGDDGDVGGRIGQVRLHGPDGQPELFFDILHPDVV